jgi:hypothetical protein
MSPLGKARFMKSLQRSTMLTLPSAILVSKPTSLTRLQPASASNTPATALNLGISLKINRMDDDLGVNKVKHKFRTPGLVISL